MARQLETLEDLYLDELRDLYHAEIQLVKVLPEMARAASSDELRKAFQDDTGRTERHVQRLKTIFERFDKDPAGHRCKGMEGLLQEGQDLIKQRAKPPVLDAGLIVTAQKAQHYEIAGYGSVCAFANMLNRQDDARLLHETLEEEKHADAHLTELARTAINLVSQAA